MNTSRTRNASKNALIGLLSQIIRVLFEFIVRTFFIKTLGSEYLGVNGLFTNILTILSFAELGIGNAIIFSMYKEVAVNNINKIKSLMDLYKKSYIAIGLIITILGILVTPFITYIINEEPNINENIQLIYLLFLANTSVSYFFAYKKAIISAQQKEYIISFFKLISEMIKATLQIIVLITTKNFILYLIIQILCTILDNVLSIYKANKMFPYLKNCSAKELELKEKKNIFSNVKSLVLYKFGSIILNGTDNIIISKMLNLVTVGIVSNFNLIITTITTLVSSILNGFTASIGNLNAENDKTKQEKIMKELLLLSVWIYGLCSILFIVLSNDFITLWIGKDYTLSLLTVFAMGLHIYVNGVQFAGYSYRTTMGLFNNGKWCPVIAAIINIFLSIIFCNNLGVAGIILATSVSRLITTTWYDIFMVYKIKFNKSPIKFYVQYFCYFVITLFVGNIAHYASCFIDVYNFWGFFIKIIICTLLINLLFFLIFLRTREFKNLFLKFHSILKK